MTTPLTRVQRRRRRPTRRWRRTLLPLLIAGGVVAAVGAIVAIGLPHGSSPARQTVARTTLPAAATARSNRRRLGLVERPTGSLAEPVQDAAAVALDGRRAMLLGGLTATDASRRDIRITTPTGDHAAGQLPTALHDTAAARLGRAVYLFGGGTGANTQSDEIVRVPAAGESATIVGRLPSPSSDQSAAAIGGTVYVVGGYTGSRWLDTIVAWRPGAAARTVAHLPFPLRYAAVAAVGTRLVIAGGSLENGAASDAVLEYTPPNRRAIRIGRLPSPTTHAAAAALGEVAYVIGGRGAAVNAATARIVAVDLQTKRVRAAGSLARPRSDLAAVTLGNLILLAGGRGASGTQAGLSELARDPARHPGPPTRKAMPAARAGNVYAFDSRNRLTGAARDAKPLVYVPNSESNTVDVIDPRSYRIVEHFPVGGLPQHVVPGWNLGTLYVTNDTGNSLTPIDPRTGKPGAQIPVDDPYNMYFTPDGRYAIVVAERLRRLDFRDAHSFRLHHSLPLPCAGVDHMDFTADGRDLLASCEFSGQLVEVDVHHERVVRTIALPDGPSGMPQDVKLSPDGRIFYVADMYANGLWEIDARRFRLVGFLPTGLGAHGLYLSRDAKLLYVSNRGEGSISVVNLRTRKVITKWRIPGGGSLWGKEIRFRSGRRVGDPGRAGSDCASC